MTMRAPLRRRLPAVFLAASALFVAAPCFAETTYGVVKTEPKLVVGASETATVGIEGKNGWHLNQEAPVSLTLTPDTGLEVPKAKLVRADLAVSKPEQIRFDVPVSAKEPGAKKVVAEAKFVMCQAEACKPAKETVTLAFDVAPAPAAKPAGRKAKASKP